MASFDDKKRELSTQLRRSAGEVRLRKDLTHLFRGRETPQSTRLDVRAFDQVLEVDSATGRVDVEGMTSYEALAAATFAKGVLPAVVPQLKGITIGGACAGLGIESSSFRYGLAHETVEELEILLPDGDVVVATPANEHSDLFFGFPNSFGTLGYALRIRARTIAAKPYVELTHHRFSDAAKFFAAVSEWCGRRDADYVDGVVFGRGEYFLTVGRFVDEAPHVSDYTYLNIYYRSIRTREKDYLKTLDYIWRWDTDWFWCSHELGAQNPIVRRLLGKKRLNSVFYKQLIDWPAGYQIRRFLRMFSSTYRENVIQDVDVTVDNGPEFLDFMLREVDLLPMWICPFRAYDRARRFPLFPTKGEALYVNFGFWDQKVTREQHAEGHFNLLVEAKLTELGGIKSLYSDSFYDEEAFWRIYGGGEYRKLKDRYDPKGRLSDLYRKCVKRQ
ncbi:FAD-binding oxidoreductase [soil metagenome]